MKKEIRDYTIDFGDKVVDVPELQASLIIQQVLDALDIDVEEIKITSEVKYTFEATKEGVGKVEFPRGEPEYWHAEADLIEKMVEVSMDDYTIRIPFTTILFWFAKEEDNR